MFYQMYILLLLQQCLLKEDFMLANLISKNNVISLYTTL